ncbi:hypothetical protein ACFVVM_08195 [Nocardia sp. NPDC058176]|uniref:hypothetical protein n=1 Tax=Nocardia sp. NPDC058176 TaxID=3346368 RepID=UPI0036DF4439
MITARLDGISSAHEPRGNTMIDPQSGSADSMPVPLFSAPHHSDASSSTTDPVPGNVLPTFLAAPLASDTSGQDRPS